ncbi:death domain-containing protein [Caerostris extrusa]|uniref:Death domain-containing protein n=1 Tax=Caerostris extrusa TaxID=172846 RepID=A0AAV4XCQ8_CAEEX|nr:death domain-containing protein [Caerostris extrusa]
MPTTLDFLCFLRRDDVPVDYNHSIRLQKIHGHRIQIVECDYRLVKTDFIQKYFFSTSIEGDPTQYSSSIRLSIDGSSTPIGGNFFWNDADFSREEAPWISVVGKMLTRANTGQDWIALAKRLGYSERETRRFAEETIPPVSVLNNWIESNGRTKYCIDLLIACLEQMSRQDVADYIFTELGPELPSPPVFISGEALYGKIYEGINKAKVVLCCLTPRYVLSPLCTREMSLADVLRKPIVPIILESMPWPPPGALALILSSLVYIDLCGIGGHGGNGKQTDWESKFSNIVERLSHFISPSFLSPRMTNPPSEKHVASSPPVLIRNQRSFWSHWVRVIIKTCWRMMKCLYKMILHLKLLRFLIQAQLCGKILAETELLDVQCVQFYETE